jgi:hypothetical protein
MSSDNRCQARQALHSNASDEERQCNNQAGIFFFEGSYGVRKLCDSHTESYRKAGFEVKKVSIKES